MLFHLKKTRYAFVLLTVGTLAFGSCGKREGAPDIRGRLVQVYSEETMMMGESELYHYERHLSEQWNWDGKELYRIDYYDSPPYSEVFFYDGRQISRTTIPAYNIRNEFVYDGRMLERIDCYRKDTLLYSCRFRHEDDRMAGMDIHHTDNPATSNQKADLFYATFSPLMGEMAGRLLAEDQKRLVESRQKKGCKGGYEEQYDFTWNDDDVTLITHRVGSDLEETELSYDDGRNPYAQLFGYREINTSPVMGFRMLSEHNVISATVRGNETRVYNCSYQYDGKYPIRRTVTYSYEASDIQTLEETTYSCTHVDEYRYED